MTLLLSDPRVTGLPVRDLDEPLVPLDARYGARGPGRLVRRSVADRLDAAQASLPDGLSFRVAEGFRTPDAQQAIITSYAASLRRLHPTAGEAEVVHLTSRYVAPLAVAPHVAGAALDLTLVDDTGHELWLGCALDATPEESGGACVTAAPVDAEARLHRDLMAIALAGAGFVNYPTEWWHWSFGDRYWACLVGAEAALYGPARTAVAA